MEGMLMKNSGIARRQRLGLSWWSSADGSPPAKFCTRNTPVNAYCPFYFSYIITFVTGFSKSSHISDCTRLPPAAMCSYIIYLTRFVRISIYLSIFRYSTKPHSWVLSYTVEFEKSQDWV